MEGCFFYFDYIRVGLLARVYPKLRVLVEALDSVTLITRQPAATGFQVAAKVLAIWQ